MKRVMFSLLAAFGLASALAAQETGNPPIARIGEVEYSDFVSFFAAFQAIPANTRTEVALLADVVVPGYVPVAAGQVIDFDLNGHRFETTTQPDNASRHYYAINNYGTLTIDDSSTGKTGVIYARGVQNLGAGTLTVKGGRIVSCDENGGAAIWNEATLTITGGTFTTEFVGLPSDQYGPGCLNNQGTALITGGTFTSDNRRTYAIISTGELEITPAEGSEVTVFGAHGALSSDGGTAVVNGGSYTSTEYYGLYVSNDGRNSETMQAAVTVNGGTFDGKTYSVWIGSDVNDPVNSTILITGGTFLDPLNRQDVAREDAIVITGGMFSVAPPAEFYPEGYLPVLTEEGTYEVSDTAAVASVTTESGTIGYPSLQAAFDAATEGQTITLLKDVTDTPRLEVVGGKQVTIDLNGHDIGFAKDGYFHVYGGSLTLTGAGKVYEQSPYWGAILIQGATQDAADYSVVDVGESVMLEGWAPIFINNNNGCAYGVKVTLAGTANSVADTSGAMGHAIYINGTIKALDGNVPQITLTETSKVTSLANGIYAAGYAEWRLAGEIDAPFPLSIKCGTFDITGGAYRATGPFADIAVANGNGSEDTGAAVSITTNDGYAPKTVVNITGGTFTSENGYAFYEGIAKKADGTLAAKASTAVIAISGGTFSGSTTNEAIKDSSAIAITTAENKKVITGGAFSTKPDADYLPEYYVTEDEAGADGLFAVSPTFDPTWYNTEATAFVISDVPDLLAFAQVVNSDRDTFAGKTVTLAANLDLAGVAWTPIGDNGCGGISTLGFFAGTFEGNNRTIDNVACTISGGTRGAGLFGLVRGAIIRDLSVSGNFVNETGFAGGVVGVIDKGSGTTIANVALTGGSVSGTNAGGIVGRDYHSEASVIENCRNAAAITATGGNAGGIVSAIAEGVTLRACANAGAVSGVVSGGVVGELGAGRIERCAGGTAAITGTTAAGRLIGALATGGNASATIVIDDTNGDAYGSLGTIGKATVKNTWGQLVVESGTLHGTPECVGVGAVYLQSGAFWVGNPDSLDEAATEGTAWMYQGDWKQLEAYLPRTTDGERYLYGGFATLLDEAESGETLCLCKAEVSVSSLPVASGVTIDLNGHTLVLDGVDMSTLTVSPFVEGSGAVRLEGAINLGGVRLTDVATTLGKEAVTLTAKPTEAEYETGRVALFTATDVPANLTVTAEPADGQEAADGMNLAVEGGTLYCNLLYLADRVVGETEGVLFDDNAKQCLATAAPYGHFTVTGESAGKALTTEEVNDALACFEGNGLVVADEQSLKVGYQFGIVGASYKAGTLTVTAQVQDLAGNPLAFADAVGLTLVDAATGEAIKDALPQVNEDEPGTVTFTATLQNAPETLRLAVRASTTAAD